MLPFEQFTKEMRESCEIHAKRKGYSNGGVDGDNHLAEFKWKIGLEPQHSIGEIIFKCIEYLAHPRRILLVKIASWAYMLYRYGPED